MTQPILITNQQAQSIKNWIGKFLFFGRKRVFFTKAFLMYREDSPAPPSPPPPPVNLINNKRKSVNKRTKLVNY